MLPPRFRRPNGFEDTLPADAWKWHTVERIARETAELYRFFEIRTPVLEQTALFHRGVGEGSDIIRKETFTFDDRGGDSMTLRPEGTAGVVRAMIEHGFLNDQGARAKVYYIAPNFRYERPQKGRLRQHHQFGAEAFGIPDADQDVECIQLQMDFYRRCGLHDFTLRINSLGDAESKARFRDAIREHLSPHASELSEDSQRRLETNPLRILDSKDPRDQSLIDKVAFSLRYLSAKSESHLDRVQKLLDAAAVNYFVDSKLVRGFDYYTETLWEVTAGGLGAQNAIGGGGRYDNLVEQLGGRPTPGVGFGSGLERLLIALDAQGVQLPHVAKPLIWLAYHGEAAKLAQIKLMQELRAAGFAADMDLAGRSIKAQFKLSDREKAAVVVIVGESELANGTVMLKNLATGEQSAVARADLLYKLPR
ncbi:MAG: histidine--tRNA ligase [Tepidisphaerales bacterium]